jgi:DNA polymerase V
MKKVALIDCNSFYASCEQVFVPRLYGKPVIVLSNNDGCIVARSKEAKAAGIKMGEPLFKVQNLIQKHSVQVFSSNYALYGDMSDRVMQTLGHFSPKTEIYSIDEAFIELEGFQSRNLTDYGQQMRNTVRRHTGVPVSIGIAPTKTLAKVANHLAKVSSAGVVDVDDIDLNKILAEFEIEDVWGIGRRWGRSLRQQGIETALQLRNTDLRWAKQKYNVVMQRTILELRGQSCIPLDLAPPTRQSICCSRSFSRPVTELQELKEAIATYVSRAAEKLRLYHLTANILQVFAHTNRFKKDDYYSNGTTITLPLATQDTRELVFFALRGAEAIYRPGHRFVKAGVLLLELQSETLRQGHLFLERDEVRSALLMKTVDAINSQFGRGTLQFAAAGLKKSWGMRQGKRSNRWTTCWGEIPVVRA